MTSTVQTCVCIVLFVALRNRRKITYQNKQFCHIWDILMPCSAQSWDFRWFKHVVFCSDLCKRDSLVLRDAQRERILPFKTASADPPSWRQRASTLHFIKHRCQRTQSIYRHHVNHRNLIIYGNAYFTYDWKQPILHWLI